VIVSHTCQGCGVVVREAKVLLCDSCQRKVRDVRAQDLGVRISCLEPGCDRSAKRPSRFCKAHSLVSARTTPSLNINRAARRPNRWRPRPSVNPARERLADRERYLRGERCEDCGTVCSGPSECVRIIAGQIAADRAAQEGGKAA
jgi:hypothetical protein